MTSAANAQDSNHATQIVCQSADADMTNFSNVHFTVNEPAGSQSMCGVAWLLGSGQTQPVNFDFSQLFEHQQDPTSPFIFAESNSTSATPIASIHVDPTGPENSFHAGSFYYNGANYDLLCEIDDYDASTAAFVTCDQ